MHGSGNVKAGLVERSAPVDGWFRNTFRTVVMSMKC